MATSAELSDPLFNLRLSTTKSTSPILSTSEDAASSTTDEISQATHITFENDSNRSTFSLTSPTRFAPNNNPIDLRSIYYAWLNKDASLPDYISAVQRLNEDLPSGAGGSVVNLSFAQKIELIAWLNGETDSSESITLLEGAGVTGDAQESAAVVSGKTGGVALDKGEGGMKVDERLMVIYDGERKMGDHNSVLRGSKPVDFSSYRKIAQSFFRSKNPSTGTSSIPTAPSHATPMVANLSKPKRRLEQPIILLSPSASSLLRMSNVKSFLDDGVFIPPNTTDATTSNLLYVQRTLPSISSTPFKFILVDSTANFKPTYWGRVVAIFTTGQTWQFKSYKYPNPAELFNHYPGVYIGWQGENAPDSVANWGRGVLTVKVDKWQGGSAGRWRDREVVESIWGRIEEYMRRGGWNSMGPPQERGGR